MAHDAPDSPHGSSPRTARRRRRAPGIVILCLLLAAQAGNARASEPLLDVLKTTLLGGMTGLILGGTLTLVVDEGSRSDTVRWGVVIGTFAGCGVGIWQAATGRDDLFSSAGPAGARAPVAARAVQASDAFDRIEGPAAAGGWSVRLSLLQWRW